MGSLESAIEHHHGRNLIKGFTDDGFNDEMSVRNHNHDI